MRFKGRYGTLWTSRANSDEEWEFIMEDWLEELSKFTIEQVRAAVNKTLAEFTTFPPTLGQLVELCMKESGVPEPHEVIRLMVAREFSHPLVKMIYDKVGSWTLTNGKSEEIERKVKEYYTAARSEFYIEPKLAWQQLESFNAKPKELSAPSKIPSTSELKAFKECMSRCQEILQDKKIAGGGKTYKQYDENQIKKGHADFNLAIFNEYKVYLMSIPETETMTLPPAYLYDRNRFLNAREQAAWLKEQGYVPESQRVHKTQDSHQSIQGRPTKVYKNWTHD